MPADSRTGKPPGEPLSHVILKSTVRLDEWDDGCGRLALFFSVFLILSESGGSLVCKIYKALTFTCRVASALTRRGTCEGTFHNNCRTSHTGDQGCPPNPASTSSCTTKSFQVPCACVLTLPLLAVIVSKYDYDMHKLVEMVKNYMTWIIMVSSAHFFMQAARPVFLTILINTTSVVESPLFKCVSLPMFPISSKCPKNSPNLCHSTPASPSQHFKASLGGCTPAGRA